MKHIIGSLVFAVASSPAWAIDATPFFSVYAGAGSWSTELSGDLGDTSTDIDDLGFDDEDNGYFYAAFEHAVPVVPNVRLEYIDLSTSGSGATDGFLIDELELVGDIDSELDLTFTDIVLYYEIAMLDFGLTFRQFDAEISAEGSVAGQPEIVTERESADGVLPMLYAQAKVELPLTGFYITGSFSGISVGDISITDLRGAAGYGIELGPVAEVGVELGLRSFTLDLGDDEDFSGDIEFSGVYFGVGVKI